MKPKLLFLFVLLPYVAFADRQAVTDEGDIVILKDDGTWEFADSTIVESIDIDVNPTPYEKSETAKFKLKSVKTNSEVWIDAKKWSFAKGASDEDAEYNFQIKGGDVYGQLISEQIELDIVTLTTAALDNARSASPGMKMTALEYRTVNETKVLFMKMEGAIQGTNYTFAGYYYSNSSGSTQFLTYTGANLYDRYSEDIEMFLNGFTAP